MGLFDRLTSVFKDRAHPGGGSDPDELMTVSLAKSEELLSTLSVAMADLTAGGLRLDIQIDQLRATQSTLEAHAKEALGAGREDLARIALTRRAGVDQQTQALIAQRDALRADREKMALTEQRLRARIDAFRTQRDTIQAQYSAAEASVKVNEAVSGLSEDMADMTAAASKAQDRADGMRARTEALDELITSGSLEDLNATDALDRQVEGAAESDRVNTELERLKREIEAGPAGGRPATGQ